MADILLTVSGFIPDDIHEQVDRGERPRADYLALAEGLPADLLDYGCLTRDGSRFSRIVARLLGMNAGLAVEVFQRCKNYPVLLTDGEQVGMPLAFLLKIFGRGSKHSKHIMIAHILTVGKKIILFDLFRLQSHIDRFLVYSTYQAEFIQQRWHLTQERVKWIPFQVDVKFFSPSNGKDVPVERLISSAGLEFRDYPTLMEAVDGLDLQVFLAAASPWSKRADSTQQYPLPANVKVGRLRLDELRNLYARSSLVVVPLDPVEFQAGVTTLLEAMAMGKAVIVTKTKGQTDVVVDGETGVYVSPRDVPALRAAILDLMEDTVKRMKLGEAARQQVVHSMSLEKYIQNIRIIAEEVGAQGESCQAGG